MTKQFGKRSMDWASWKSEANSASSNWNWDRRNESALRANPGRRWNDHNAEE